MISSLVLSAKIHHLREVFQSLGIYKRKPKVHPVKGRYTGYDIWREGDSEPPGYVRAFNDLIESFLHYGPAGPTDPNISKGITIDYLELEFADPEDISLLPPEPVTVREKYRALRLHRYHYSRDDEPTKMLRPEWLLEDLASDICSLLCMGYREARYDVILYERIGSLAFNVYGNIAHEFDIDQILADLKFHDGFGEKEWKKPAMQKGHERGLKVVEPNTY